MKNQYKKIVETTLSAILILFMLNSCESWREDCTGQIIVENEIPDTTLYVGGKPFTKDISEPPIVFRHTENRAIKLDVISYDVGENGQFIVLTKKEESPNTGKLHLIVVQPNSEGTATVEVFGGDGCLDGETTTRFNVTVIDTIRNKNKYSEEETESK